MSEYRTTRHKPGSLVLWTPTGEPVRFLGLTDHHGEWARIAVPASTRSGKTRYLRGVTAVKNLEPYNSAPTEAPC